MNIEYTSYYPQTSSSSSSSCIGFMDQNDNVEETYTSSLFQTEPLYQFYDSDVIKQVRLVISSDICFLNLRAAVRYIVK